MYPNVHSSIIYGYGSNPSVHHRWTDKDEVVYTLIHTHTHTHTHTHMRILAIKNNEILQFAATWMDLEGIMLSEISQTEKEKSVCSNIHMESKTLKKWLNITKQKQRYRKRTTRYQTDEKREEGQVLW